MKRNIIFLLLSIFGVIQAQSQTNYTGYVEGRPMQLSLIYTSIKDVYQVRALFCFTDTDEPSIFRGRRSNSLLQLYKVNEKGDTLFALEYFNFEHPNGDIVGCYTDFKTRKKMKASLASTGIYEFLNIDKKGEKMQRQLAITSKHYFNLTISPESFDFFPIIKSIRVFERGTDSLIQQINLNPEPWDFEVIDTGDFNFDGHTDFSVRMYTTANSNFQRLKARKRYYLFDPKSQQYYDSNFPEDDIKIDNKNKRLIIEMTSTLGHYLVVSYSVKQGVLQEVSSQCFKQVGKTDKYIPVKLSECE